MADVALYYPHIDPPQNAWTTRALLYWDRVDAIIPSDVDMQTSTRQLIDEGLLHRVQWWDVMEPAHELAPALVRYVDEKSHGVSARKPRVNDRRYWSRIHVMKMPYQFLDALSQTSLGEPIDSDWWSVRPDIATDFMTALAYGVARHRDSPTDLLTDMTPPLGGRWALPRLGTKILDHTARGVSFELALALQTLFPVPRELLPIKELARFKKTYGEMLPLFRSKVHHELGMLSTIPEEGVRQERLRDLIRAWKEESDAIQRQLEPSGLSFMRRAIIPSMVGLATYALAPDRADLAVIVPTVCALGQAALEAWTGPGDRRDAVRAQPIAYAALFTHELRGARR